MTQADINNAICDELERLEGWIVNAQGRWWVCSKQVAGALVRRLSPDEVDAIQGQLIPQ